MRIYKAIFTRKTQNQYTLEIRLDEEFIYSISIANELRAQIDQNERMFLTSQAKSVALQLHRTLTSSIEEQIRELKNEIDMLYLHFPYPNIFEKLYQKLNETMTDLIRYEVKVIIKDDEKKP